MVAAPAAADAIERARRLPNLRIGLHIVLVESWPALSPSVIPDLVDTSGRLRADMARFGLDLALRPRVRRQLAAEIAAQFEAFRATGLPLDHVNAHKHYHLHPVIAAQVIRIGHCYSMRALRAPVEPAAVLARVEPGSRSLEARVAAPWAALLRLRARRAGLTVPDAVFGLAWSGAMTEPRLAGLLAQCPDGLTEIYTHPAMAGGFEGQASGYRYGDELAALLSRACREAAAAAGARLGGYADFLSSGSAPNASA
jgi:chitin disaccharide deacetylase